MIIASSRSTRDARAAIAEDAAVRALARHTGGAAPPPRVADVRDSPRTAETRVIAEDAAVRALAGLGRDRDGVRVRSRRPLESVDERADAAAAAVLASTTLSSAPRVSFEVMWVGSRLTPELRAYLARVYLLVGVGLAAVAAGAWAWHQTGLRFGIWSYLFAVIVSLFALARSHGSALGTRVAYLCLFCAILGQLLAKHATTVPAAALLGAVLVAVLIFVRFSLLALWTGHTRHGLVLTTIGWTVVVIFWVALVSNEQPELPVYTRAILSILVIVVDALLIYHHTQHVIVDFASGSRDAFMHAGLLVIDVVSLLCDIIAFFAKR
jgi:FtsH-binding integral membrane protein